MPHPPHRTQYQIAWARHKLAGYAHVHREIDEDDNAPDMYQHTDGRQNVIVTYPSGTMHVLNATFVLKRKE